MKYFKNIELARLYHISEKSVRNWIEAAQQGKIDLQLHTEKDKNRAYIANTIKNNAAIEKLVARGKKYKNTRGFKTISPRKRFYATFSQKQILDIITNLEVHREVPLEYTYFDGGATYWDKYAKRLVNEGTLNILTKTIELLDTTADGIDRLIGNKKVNVVDLGPGNGLPIRSTIARLLKQGNLERYIAIDTSQEMLQILEQNMREWFGTNIKFEAHVRDFSYERFGDLLAEDYTRKHEGDIPINFVFLLGNTLNNFRNPGQTLLAINNSVGVNDFLVYSCYMDTPNTRRYFDFNTSNRERKVRSEYMLEDLGIDESLYDIEQTYNEAKRARYFSFVPKVDLSVKFELENSIRHVELRKGSPILLGRFHHKNIVETVGQFDQHGFDLMLAVKSENQDYLLSVSKIKTGIDS